MTLRLDFDGVIREASFANSVSAEGTAGLLGRPWIDTVGEVGSDKVRDLVADATANGVSAFRQVTQRFPSGLELPIEYNAVRLGAKAGLIAVGRSLQAVIEVQSRFLSVRQARENDAWRLRGVETRSRLLFETSQEPILLIGAEDFRILDANAAAIRTLAGEAGPDLLAAIAPGDREPFRAVMADVRERGRAPGVLLHFGAAAAPWMVRASLATAAPENVVLLQLRQAAAPIPVNGTAETLALGDILERMPDGFVLVDAEGTVLRVNQAFLDLVQVPAGDAAVGEKLGRWLSRPGADAASLLTYAMRQSVVRAYLTSVTGELGSEIEVEISVAGDAERAPRHFALMLRDVSRRLPAAPVGTLARTTPGQRLIEAVASRTEQVGRIPLLQLLRETGGLIEQHYIEWALAKAHGNRTAAAELLGLSRQSFYAKLGRHAGAEVE